MLINPDKSNDKYSNFVSIPSKCGSSHLKKRKTQSVAKFLYLDFIAIPDLIF
jgi:hypothetical protein